MKTKGFDKKWPNFLLRKRKILGWFCRKKFWKKTESVKSSKKFKTKLTNSLVHQEPKSQNIIENLLHRLKKMKFKTKDEDFRYRLRGAKYLTPIQVQWKKIKSDWSTLSQHLANHPLHKWLTHTTPKIVETMNSLLSNFSLSKHLLTKNTKLLWRNLSQDTTSHSLNL